MEKYFPIKHINYITVSSNSCASNLMDIERIQSGGYDSGLGDEVGLDCDGCWAPPPSTAPSPEPLRSGENAVNSHPVPDFEHLLMRFKNPSKDIDLLKPKESPEGDDKPALFVSSPLETIYEQPVSDSKSASFPMSQRHIMRTRRRHRLGDFRNYRLQYLLRKRDSSAVQDISKRFNSLQV